jgi:hypothetical protein
MSDDQLAAIVSRHRRVWFVLYPDDWVPQYETSRRIETALNQRFHHVRETRKYTVILRLYSQDEVGPSNVAQLLPR